MQRNKNEKQDTADAIATNIKIQKLTLYKKNIVTGYHILFLA